MLIVLHRGINIIIIINNNNQIFIWDNPSVSMGSCLIEKGSSNF